MHAFQRCIDSSAMKYGIGRLPNELLLQIFSIVATDMRSTVGLSHVCQRFRSIVNGTPSFWENFWLSTGWKADQVITVAERCELHNLKAVIEGDFYFEMETTHHRLFAISAILSLSDHLVELDIRSLDAPTHVQIFRHHRNKHGSTIFPRLRSLLSKRSTNIALLFRSSEIIEMPSLQVLSVDFVPHVSQAGNLTRLAITGSTYRLSGLIVFLTSATALEELLLEMTPRSFTLDMVEQIEQTDAYLPKLTQLVLIMDPPPLHTSLFISKVHAPCLRILQLHANNGILANEEIQGVIGSKPSFTELHLSSFHRIDLCRIPAQVKTLTVTDVLRSPESSPPGQLFDFSGTVDSLSLRLIRFKSSLPAEIIRPFVAELQNALCNVGLDRIEIVFREYHGHHLGVEGSSAADILSWFAI